MQKIAAEGCDLLICLPATESIPLHALSGWEGNYVFPSSGCDVGFANFVDTVCGHIENAKANVIVVCTVGEYHVCVVETMKYVLKSLCPITESGCGSLGVGDNWQGKKASSSLVTIKTLSG